MKVLLIHPPLVKPCEPPAGIAGLWAALRRHQVDPIVFDANIGGLLHLLNRPPGAKDTWTDRASRHLPDHLTSLRSRRAYRTIDAYKRSVKDLNRLLEQAGLSAGVRMGLSNYEDRELSPVRSDDLLRAAERPELNPFFPYLESRLPDLLNTHRPGVIGLSLNYLSQALSAFAIVGLLRKACPEARLVLGGGLVTSWMGRQGWRNPFHGLVDALVSGPGEGPLLSFLNTLPGSSKGNGDGTGVLPFAPDYEAFPPGDYLSPGPILPYSASRGCYWSRCAFCPEKAERNAYLPVPLDTVIQDLHCLVERMEPVLIHFLDNAMSPGLLKRLCESPPGAPWYGFVRVTEHLTDPGFCKALKRSGCVMLQLGLESGDQGVLDRMGKGIRLDQASLALKNLKEAGIASYVYLLFGTPWETAREAGKTLEFTAAHADGIGFLNIAIFNLPVFSEGSYEVETRSFYAGDLSLYTDFLHPDGWNRASVRQFLDKEFRRHPAIAPILRRDPPYFTSNHAPFLAFPGSEMSGKISKSYY